MDEQHQLGNGYGLVEVGDIHESAEEKSLGLVERAEGIHENV